jgi:hypothetical protein
MARVHADAKIRPSYVREVCRLLKASNINIVKTDLEFEDNQIAINEERNMIPASEDATNDLFVSSFLLTFGQDIGEKQKVKRKSEPASGASISSRAKEDQNYLRRISEDRLHGSGGYSRAKGGRR